MTFTATDGKEWTLDEWHPLPFLLKTDMLAFAGVPTTSAGHLLVRLFPDGKARPWGWVSSFQQRLYEQFNPPTHWMVRSWSDYAI